jgi:hypothetical protein
MTFAERYRAVIADLTRPVTDSGLDHGFEQ